MGAFDILPYDLRHDHHGAVIVYFIIQFVGIIRTDLPGFPRTEDCPQYVRSQLKLGSDGRGGPVG